MTQVTLTFDGRNHIAQKTLDYIMSLGVFKHVSTTKTSAKESPYDPEFVKKIKASEKSEVKIVDIDTLWD